jgi:DNA-dependent RNA polymerase auxiliary subunit epsilon
MAPAVQNQINFPCRKMSVRRKMDFDDDLASPTKSPRKGKSFAVELLNKLGHLYLFLFIENCDTAEETEQTVRLTRSSSRRTQTPTPSKPHRIRASPKKTPRNLFKTVDTSPTKEATSSLTLRSNTPKKTPLRENLENQQVLHTDKSTSLNSPVKMKLQQPNGKYHFEKIHKLQLVILFFFNECLQSPTLPKPVRPFIPQLLVTSFAETKS